MTSRQYCYGTLLVLFLCSGLCAQTKSDGEYRTWNDTSGQHSRTAKFVKVNEGIVELQDKAGNTISIPLDKLDPASRRMARELQERSTVSVDDKSLDVTLRRVKAFEKNAVFAVDILREYKKLADSNHLPAEHKAFVDQKIRQFGELAKTRSINLGDRFIAESELPDVQLQSQELVKSWLEVSVGTNGRLGRLDRLESASQIDPLSLAAGNFMGLHYVFFERDYETAARHLSKAANRGLKFKSIYDDVQSLNLVAVLNNLALLHAREKNLSKSFKLWSQAIDSSPEEPSQSVFYNVAKVNRMLGEGGWGLKSTTSVKKKFHKLGQQLQADFKSLRALTPAPSGWYYMGPVLTKDSPPSLEFLVSGRQENPGAVAGPNHIQDLVCVLCAGNGTVRCPVAHCKRGVIIKVTPSRTELVRGGFKITPGKREHLKCGTCKGTGKVKCWACKNGVQSK